MIVLVLAALSSVQPTQAEKAGGWTILLVIHADCGSSDCNDIASVLAAFAQVGSSKHVDVLAFVDQPGGTADDPTKSCRNDPVIPAPLMNQPGLPGGRLFKVEKDRLDLLATYPSEPNMGAPESLTWALIQAHQHSSRRSLALMTITHGNPWSGLAADLSHCDALTFDEYAAGLGAASQATGRGVDLICLTHCGTSCIEALHPLSAHSSWILASEDLTDTEALPPAYVLKRLTATPQMSPRDLGLLCADAYDLSDEGGAGDSQGIALIDCSAVPGFRSALGLAVQPIVQRLSAGDSVLRCALVGCRPSEITLACGLSADCVIETGCTLQRCCMLDLRAFFERLAAQPDPDLQKAGTTLLPQLDRVVVTSKHLQTLGERGGISAYAPCRGSEVATYAGTSWALASRWDEFVSAWPDPTCLACCHEPTRSDLTSTLAARVDLDSVTVTSNVTPGGAAPASARLVIRPAGGAAVLLSVPATLKDEAAQGVLSATWDRRIWCIESAAGIFPVPTDHGATVTWKGRPWNSTLTELAWSSGNPSGPWAPEVDVLARCLLPLSEDDDVGQLLELRVKPRADGAYRGATPAVGDRLSLSPSLAAWWSRGAAEPRPPLVVTALGSVPQVLRRVRVPNGSLVEVAFVCQAVDGSTFQTPPSKPLGDK